MPSGQQRLVLTNLAKELAPGTATLGQLGVVPESRIQAVMRLQGG